MVFGGFSFGGFSFLEDTGDRMRENSAPKLLTLVAASLTDQMLLPVMMIHEERYIVSLPY
jgi:hypothetical protein